MCGVTPRHASIRGPCLIDEIKHGLPDKVCWDVTAVVELNSTRETRTVGIPLWNPSVRYRLQRAESIFEDRLEELTPFGEWNRACRPAFPPRTTSDRRLGLPTENTKRYPAALSRLIVFRALGLKRVNGTSALHRRIAMLSQVESSEDRIYSAVDRTDGTSKLNCVLRIGSGRANQSTEPIRGRVQPNPTVFVRNPRSPKFQRDVQWDLQITCVLDGFSHESSANNSCFPDDAPRACCARCDVGVPPADAAKVRASEVVRGIKETRKRKVITDFCIRDHLTSKFSQVMRRNVRVKRVAFKLMSLLNGSLEQERLFDKDTSSRAHNRLVTIDPKTDRLHSLEVFGWPIEKTYQVITSNDVREGSVSRFLNCKSMQETQSGERQWSAHVDTALGSNCRSVGKPKVHRREHLLHVLVRPMIRRYIQTLEKPKPQGLSNSMGNVIRRRRKIGTNTSTGPGSTILKEGVKLCNVRLPISIEPLLILNEGPNLAANDIARQQMRRGEFTKHSRLPSLLRDCHNICRKVFNLTLFDSSLHHGFFKKRASFCQRYELEEWLENLSSVRKELRRPSTLRTSKREASGVLVRCPRHVVRYCRGSGTDELLRPVVYLITDLVVIQTRRRRCLDDIFVAAERSLRYQFVSWWKGSSQAGYLSPSACVTRTTFEQKNKAPWQRETRDIGETTSDGPQSKCVRNPLKLRAHVGLSVMNRTPLQPSGKSHRNAQICYTSVRNYADVSQTYRVPNFLAKCCYISNGNGVRHHLRSGRFLQIKFGYSNPSHGVGRPIPWITR
ncbi:MAG: hypothetical protein SCDNV1_gp2 [Sanya cydistomyia duplonotatay narnavirus 1]|nr:MAG: hypothetical protein SCDNV1_gp2 [Sanya cydistomyia duplonotatay narnavirus 1]